MTHVSSKAASLPELLHNPEAPLGRVSIHCNYGCSGSSVHSHLKQHPPAAALIAECGLCRGQARGSVALHDTPIWGRLEHPLQPEQSGCPWPLWPTFPLVCIAALLGGGQIEVQTRHFQDGCSPARCGQTGPGSPEHTEQELASMLRWQCPIQLHRLWPCSPFHHLSGLSNSYKGPATC